MGECPTSKWPNSERDRRDYRAFVSDLWLGRDADRQVKWRVFYTNYPPDDEGQRVFVQQHREQKFFTVMVDALSGTVLCAGSCNFAGYRQ